MSIVSLQFVAFVAAVVLVYFATPQRPRRVVLLAASTLFYASFGWRPLAFLALSIRADFALAPLIGYTTEPRLRRLYLVPSLALNLGGLALFKYLAPAVRMLDTALGWLAFARYGRLDEHAVLAIAANV